MDLVGKKFGRLNVVGKNYDYITPSTKRPKLRWECLCECGRTSFVTSTKLLRNLTISCGCYLKDRKGNKNPFWRGGKYIDKLGYWNIRVDGKYVFEHRHIYETHHNVKLKPHQNVHHINGDRTDNRIENLELWDVTQPSGQRVEDKIKFYFQLVQEYKDHPEYKHLFI